MLENKSNSVNGFIDAIMFSENHGVVMIGELSEEKDLPVNRFTRARDEWFYIHARKASQKEDYRELIPIKDYFFRYDIGAFWGVKYGFDELKTPFNRLTRTLLHPFMDTSTAYESGIKGANLSSKYIVQDINTPKEEVVPFLEWVDSELEIYPLWLLPIKPDENAKLSPSYIETDLVINVGIWGIPQTGKDYEELKYRLETKAKEIGARKTLYAQQFYSKEDFWSIYDREWYKHLREEHDAEVFPDFYEFTHVEELPEPNLLKAVIPTLKSGLFPGN